MNATLDNTDRGWRAALALRFIHDGRRTILASRKHVGPLVVQRPFYSEADVPHIYLVHPPGGLVGGDHLQLDVALDANSHALITTPAATKFYRTLGRRATVEQELRLRSATLEWLPQETIIFREARAATTTRVHLGRQSRFIGWEFMCYGRPASNDHFISGEARQTFELWLDDRPVLIDRLHIDGGGMGMSASWGLARQSSLGTLVAYPATTNDLEAAREYGFACTLIDRVLVCRALSNDAETMKRAFICLWQTLRPLLLGRDAVLPRIWAT